MSRILITGGAGFIGSNLAHALIARGDTVCIIDNLSSGREENLTGILDQITFIRESILEPRALRAAMEGAEYVLHQAALPSVPRSVQDPVGSFEANVVGSMRVMEAARAAKVKRVVYAASSSAYGETPILPKVESMPAAPISPYGMFKLFGEHLCQVWTKVYGLECVALRYFNVFGPRQRPDSQYAAVIPKFILAMSQGEAPTIYGDGTQSRDFCFVENVVQANLKAMVAPKAPGNVYNIACEQRTTLLVLVGALNRILGTCLTPNLVAPRPGDIKHSLADITRAVQDLDYRWPVPFEAGLRQTVAWFRGRLGKS